MRSWTMLVMITSWTFVDQVGVIRVQYVSVDLALQRGPMMRVTFPCINVVLEVWRVII